MVTQPKAYLPHEEIARSMLGFPSRTALVYALFFIVALCSYSVLWKNAPITAPDSPGYLRAAQDLSDFHIDELPLRTPGYPLLLVLTGSIRSANRALFFVSLLLHFGCIWLLATVLFQSGLTEISLCLFGLILLLPPYVEPAAYVLSENLTEAMLVVGLVTLIYWTKTRRIIWIVISAFAFGYAGVTRPIYQILAFVIAGYFFIVNYLLHWTSSEKKAFTKASLVLICGSVVIVGGYCFLNYMSVGYFGLTPKLGLTLSQKTMRVIERLPDEYAGVRETLIKYRNAEIITGESHTGYSYIWNAIPELTSKTGLQYRELSDYMLRLNLFLIQKAPLEYLQDVAWSLASYWLPSSDRPANMNSRMVQLVWAVIHFCIVGALALNLILIIGAGTYLRASKSFVRQTNKVVIDKLKLIGSEGLIYGLAGTIVFYSTISCFIEVGLPRYRVPTDALIVFMLFLGTHLWRHLLELSGLSICGSPNSLLS